MAKAWEKLNSQTSETWKPEKKDDTIQGILVEKKADIGPNHSNIYVLETEDGKTVGVWGSSMIDNQMSKAKIGDEVKFVYLGKETNPKTNRQYKNFDIYRRPGSVQQTDDNFDSESDDETPF